MPVLSLLAKFEPQTFSYEKNVFYFFSNFVIGWSPQTYIQVSTYMNRNITTPRISGEAWGEIALIKCLCRCDMFQRLGPESLPGKISKDKFPALRACSRLFATAILATSGNNAFSPLNLTYFTPTQHRGKSKTVRINRWAKWFLLESFYSSLWQILEGSQEERPEFNKGLSENVPTADCSRRSQSCSSWS